MVKLTFFMALSTLIIAPTFASELWDIETRDVAEPRLFGRDMEVLFVREQDFELPDLARRFRLYAGAGEITEKKTEKSEAEVLVRRDDAHNGFTREQLALHRPFEKHELVSRDFDELFERDPDHEFFLRDVIDNDFFERFYDNLD